MRIVRGILGLNESLPCVNIFLISLMYHFTLHLLQLYEIVDRIHCCYCKCFQKSESRCIDIINKTSSIVKEEGTQV